MMAKNQFCCIIFALLLVMIAFRVSAECPDDEKACLEYSKEPVCKEIPNEKCIGESERLYNDCIQESERLQKECNEENAKLQMGCEENNSMGCVQKHCGEMICNKMNCSAIEKCYGGATDETCIKWGCEGELRVTVGSNITEAAVPAGLPVSEPACTSCPSGCELINDGSECGTCICPANYGFCSESGIRDIINNTKVYCLKGAWLNQKDNNLTCSNSFECISNFCSKGICYDISTQVEENKSTLQNILAWLKTLFRI